MDTLAPFLQEYDLTIRFTSHLLGTVPKNREIYADFVAEKAVRLGVRSAEEVEEETETVEDLAERGWTGFHQDANGLFLYDYTIKGYFKEACGALRRVSGSRSSKLKAYKTLIDGSLFVSPRRLYLRLPPGGEVEVIERPLRADTMKGPRVALARSDMVPPGTIVRCQLTLLGDVITLAEVREWLDYGALKGLGQWRNASWGRFVYEITPCAEEDGDTAR